MGERAIITGSGLNQEIAEFFLQRVARELFARRKRAEEIAALRGTLGADAGEDA
jgi:hypothetical protein